MASVASTSAGSGFDVIFIKRFWNIHRLIFPSVSSMSTGLFAFLLILALFAQYIIYNVGLISSRFYKVLGDKDIVGFKEVTWQSLSLIIIIALVRSIGQYVENILSITWRQLLTQSMHRVYLTGIRYYQMNVLDDAIDNPDQRITQDVDKLCTLYSSVVSKILIAPFIIAYYSYQAYSSTGWFGPTSMYVYFVIGSAINKFLMSPIVKKMIEQERREGDFRFKHMLVRVNSESLAFHESADLESHKVNEKLDLLIGAQRRLYNRQLALNVSVNMFDYLGSIISYLVLAIPIFAGVYDDLSPSDLSALISKNAFVCIYLISTFSSLVDISGKVSNLAGVVHRVAEFFEHVNTVEDDLWNNEESCESGYTDDDTEVNELTAVSHGDTIPEKNKHTVDDSSGWHLKDISFRAPHQNKTLLNGLTLNIICGDSLLIKGDSSAGKSSLLRVLKGLWPHCSGSLGSSIPRGPTGAFYIPQKPFLTTGTLREQVIYPLRYHMDADTTTENSRIMSILQMVKMDFLIDRLGSLDAEVDWNWYDILSPGEMQRLAFARVFYHKPVFAVLDEATSALSIDFEDMLHKQCRDLGITLLSVGHRDSLKQYHKRVLILDGKGGWSLKDISHKSSKSSSSSSSSDEH